MQGKTLVWVAAGSGLVAVALLQLYLARVERDALGGTPVAVLALTQDAKAGDALTPEVITTRTIPERYVDSRHITADRRAQVLGLRLATDRLGQEALQWNDLAGMQRSGKSLAELVEPGTRAMAVKLATTGIESLLRPGDRLDLLCAEADGLFSEGRQTKTLLENLMLLAVGTDLGEAGDERGGHRWHTQNLTFSVTTQQAQTLTQARRCPHLQVALRNPADVMTTGTVAHSTGGR